MASKRKSEDPPRAPTWIVSFSDMVTLLLAFFVLLQSFARVQDPELFFVGQGSFKRAIAGMGLPSWLLGRQDKPRREHIGLKHPMEEGEPVKPEPKTKDADGEKIRRMFADLKKELETSASDLSQKTIRVEPTPIRFEGPADRLSQSAKEYLQQFALDTQQTVRRESVRYYVVGLAADASGAGRQWAVSARRAASVEAYLSQLLAAGRRRRDGWSIYSWGAGAGGPWCQERGFLPERTHIVIAVVEENSENG
ncbi:MAG TPA: flagellar motor protein MotB [Phycisphaerae bacterium]|nr:flagellar motor protein MotB [Phycisphaerae bacterium]